MRNLVVLLIPLVLVSSLFAQDGYPTLSPFESLRPTGKAMEVKVAGRWYALRAIEGKSYDEIVAFCREQYGERAFKRFAEDLVQVLTEMGLEPGKKVKLELVDLDKRVSVVLDEVEMTGENRRAVWTENKNDRDFDGPVERGRRERADRDLGNSVGAKPADRRLTAAQIASDLDQLERKLRGEYSYLERGPADWQRRLEALRESAEKSGMTVAGFHLELRKFLALFGDGHSRPRRVHEAISGWLPLSFVWVEEGLVAFGPNGGLADPEHPLVEEIADRPVERAVQAAAALVTKGSPAFEKIELEFYLSAVAIWSNRRGKPESDVVFVDAEGKRKKTEFDWVSGPPRYRRPLPRKHRSHDEGRIGYLRLESMASSADFLEGLEKALDGFKKAKGLVIDLRGNGGGSRAALKLMLPRFLPAGERMIANVAIYRLPPDVENDPDTGHLVDRELWPPGSSHWSEAERAFIAAFMLDFKPLWMPRAIEGFSGPHVMLVTGTGENVGQEVVILVDEHCFSATDIFAGAFTELPSVTLVGEPTAGGSGRAQGFQLACSGIEVKLSTMVSWRPDGRLYDGLGIEVDVFIEDRIADWLGQGDRQLERALELLRRD